MKQRIVNMDCFKGGKKINIYEAVEKIVEIDLLRASGYKQEIADILQELLDTGGVGSKYMEEGK